ncbi:MAG: hypothetical protein U9P49_09250 [Thermodesulfobacteriota bacterium]|nr:hypothetical protein [Thermodesulfobacteriota bacterium]
MYIPRHFELYEMLPKDIYESTMYLGLSRWQWFDERMLQTCDFLRNTFGKMIMNTWYWGGRHQYRGWRPLDCEYGADWSQHKFGRAGDSVFMDITAHEVRKYVLAHPQEFHHITCIEMGVAWFHFDVRNYNNGILQVYPK